MKKSGFLIAIVLLACVASVSSALASEDHMRTITVTGEGRVEAAPDMAMIRLGVTSEAKEAGDAMAETSAATGRVLSRLDGLQIDPTDIQTQRITLNPVWSSRSYSGGDRNEITGFSASNIISVGVRDLDRLGEVIDAVISDGANEFNGLRFTVQEPQPLIEAARKEAVAQAMATARLLATSAGVTLGPVQSITEHGGAPQPMMMEMAAARSSGAPVAPGEITMTASVSMVFAIAE